MVARFLIAAALCPLAYAFSGTVPLLTWSSYSSETLDLLPSNARNSQTLLESILLNDDVCEIDAVVLVQQDGLHASDLRNLSPSSKLVEILSDSKSQRQFQYVTVSLESDLATTAEAVSARCGSELITLSPGSAPGHFSHDSKNVVSIRLPSLEDQVGGSRKDKVSLSTSWLADELDYISRTYPKHLVVYMGATPLNFAVQHDARQQPESDAALRPVFNSVFAPSNNTLPEGGILKRYQLLTPGLIIILLVTFFILVPMLLFGFKALASIQSPLRVEAPKGYSASDKKTQ